MTEQEILDLLLSVCAFYENDHFVLTSGRHSDCYLDFRPFYHPRHAEAFNRMCVALADRFRAFTEIELVAGLETGGAWLAEKVAEELSKSFRRVVPWIAIRKRPRGTEQEFYVDDEDRRRLHGKRVLIIDDVLTFGSALRSALQLLHRYDALPWGVGLLANRSLYGQNDFNVAAFRSLIDVKLDSWTATECRKTGLCSRGIPINVQVGHGRDYVATHGQPSIL